MEIKDCYRNLSIITLQKKTSLLCDNYCEFQKAISIIIVTYTIKTL